MMALTVLSNLLVRVCGGGGVGGRVVGVVVVGGVCHCCGVTRPWVLPPVYGWDCSCFLCRGVLLVP